ncbi:YkvA family protein [Bacillus taeanensis]|uniref:DUF1232 domain-containing protein n=1 Tax=Bacillus taeanensis TaxID=273032 RepID=A0A366XSZ9_9BACI|nr:DUF1232 domain-containing protein [Bacillus taeanensis]RBW68796.1 hypothetical protein DS031_14720 [Bacillus taeanensis]
MKLAKYFKRLKFIFKVKKFIPFLKEFFLSGEVLFQKKVISVFMILAYVFFPFDLIPDFLSFFGIIDDVVIATFLLERMIKMAPQSLKEKYALFD